MLLLGDYNELEVMRLTVHGAFLDSADGDVLLPGRYVPTDPEPKAGDVLRVFVYRDTEDRLVATTERPLAKVDEFAALTVREVNAAGAWLDWGLDAKDLLLPWRQQRRELRPGEKVTVFVYLDDVSDRLVATAKFSRFLDPDTSSLEAGQSVGLLVAQETDLGFSVIIEQRWSGVLYRNEVFQALKVGDQVAGFIKRVRPDGKVDVALQASGYEEAVADATATLLDALRAAGGRLPLSDSSDPAEIHRLLRMSKKTFKKALGQLYRSGVVTLDPACTTLVQID
jgi:uncharacterized protein